jgi:trimethylamine--corrinoid protein Co-methyltransferase
VPIVIEILSTILGSEEEVIKRKIYSVCYCTLAPLVHEGEMCDAYLDLIEFEAPILIYPMPCTGATGPCSLYSNIVQGNAEALSALVLFQMARPGTPLIFGDASGSTNFATASRDRRRWGCRRGHGGRWRGSTACRTRSRDVRAMPRSRVPRRSWRR